VIRSEQTTLRQPKALRSRIYGIVRHVVNDTERSGQTTDTARLRLVAQPMSGQPSPLSITYAALVAAACFTLAATRALGAPVLLVDLEYTVDPALQGCPSSEDFRNMVGQQLGYDPYRADADLHVVVRAQSAERGIEGAIDWNAPTQQRVGERRFTSRSRDCRELVTAMGFVVAVEIQILATDLTASPASEPQASKAATPDPHTSDEGTESIAKRPQPTGQPRPQPIELPTSAPGSAPWSAVVGLGTAAGIGLGPNLTALGRVFFGLQHSPASLELGAEASLPTTTRQADGVGFRQNLIVGTIAACGRYQFASACAVGQFGQIRVSGLGVDVPSSPPPTGFIAQAGPRLAATVGLGEQLLLTGHADALFLLTPWTVELNNTGIWTMPRLGAVLGIDLAARFR
jgi:hypothetical protein